MTHIVSPDRYPTKKKFLEAVRRDPSRVTVYDPAIVSPESGRLDAVLSIKKSIVVTNHPKRSWFAEVRLTDRGEIRGS